MSIKDNEKIVIDIGENTDGYHTYNELYRYRKLYNAALFNEWAKKDLYQVHKSPRHHSGEECFGGGYFVVMAELPTGQISNHYKTERDWDLFKIQATEFAAPYDGHTPDDVANRLEEFLKHFMEKDES